MAPRPHRPRDDLARLGRALLALAVGVASIAGCAHTRGTFESPILEDVELRGVRSVDAGDLASKLVTQRQGLPDRLLPWAAPPRLDRAALDVDRLRIEAYYRTHGHYAAKVVAADVVFDGPGRARVAFRVDEGPPVRVTAVEVIGLDAAPEAKARVGKLPLQVGAVFTEADYDATRARIADALLQTGYAEGKVEPSANVVPEEKVATARYVVDAGRRWRFGPIDVKGAVAVPVHMIRRQAELEVKQGEFWDESKLAAARARVSGLGALGGVRVARGTPDPETGTIPVVVTVSEAPFRTVRAGPGLGIEATRWEARALAGWTNRNAFGGLQRLSFDGRAGYAWLPNPIDWTKEGPVGQLTAQFYQPSAISTRIDLSLRADLERGLEPAYDFWSERFRAGLPVRLTQHLSFVPSYNIELYQVAGDLAAGTNTSQLACAGEVCAVSYFEERIRWDRLNDPIETRRGFALALAVQEGFAVGSYGYQYLRFLPEAEAFFSLLPGTVLALRFRVGALVPVNESQPPPITARFLAGGPGSMRGFNTRRLAPYALDKNGKWVPVGGNGLADGSAELRVGVQGNWSGALFVDMGNVSDYSSVPSAWKGALDPTLFQWAAGVGVRYRTPLGPLRLDGGVRLPTRWRKGDSWSEGLPPLPGLPPDRNEPIFTVHVSLGDSF
jgi:translocation and assembly module TamA